MSDGIIREQVAFSGKFGANPSSRSAGPAVFDVLVSFLVITFLLALVFKLLPDVTVSWKDVWIGAIFTAVLFMIGKLLIGVYIGSASMGSIYSAAGSLMVVLVWTFYSSKILFFGAELIRICAKYNNPTDRPYRAGDAYT